MKKHTALFAFLVSTLVVATGCESLKSHDVTHEWLDNTVTQTAVTDFNDAFGQETQAFQQRDFKVAGIELAADGTMRERFEQVGQTDVAIRQQSGAAYQVPAALAVGAGNAASAFLNGWNYGRNWKPLHESNNSSTTTFSANTSAGSNSTSEGGQGGQGGQGAMASANSTSQGGAGGAGGTSSSNSDSNATSEGGQGGQGGTGGPGGVGGNATAHGGQGGNATSDSSAAGGVATSNSGATGGSSSSNSDATGGNASSTSDSNSTSEGSTSSSNSNANAGAGQ